MNQKSRQVWKGEKADTSLLPPGAQSCHNSALFVRYLIPNLPGLAPFFSLSFYESISMVWSVARARVPWLSPPGEKVFSLYPLFFSPQPPFSLLPPCVIDVERPDNPTGPVIIKHRNRTEAESTGEPRLRVQDNRDLPSPADCASSVSRNTVDKGGQTQRERSDASEYEYASAVLRLVSPPFSQRRAHGALL